MVVVARHVPAQDQNLNKSVRFFGGVHYTTIDGGGILHITQQMVLPVTIVPSLGHHNLLETHATCIIQGMLGERLQFIPSKNH